MQDHQLRLLALVVLSLTILGCSSRSDRKELGTAQLPDGGTLAMYEMYPPVLTGPNRLGIESSPNSWTVEDINLSKGDREAPARVVGSGEVEVVLPDTTWWTARFALRNQNDSTVRVQLPLRAGASESQRLDRVVGPDSLRYWVGIAAPLQAMYGIQPLEVAVYKQDTTNSFSPADSLQFTIQPWMQMGDNSGHSSSFNREPVMSDSLLPGHYIGQVSYSMKGKWELRLGLFQKDGTPIDTARFEVHVKK